MNVEYTLVRELHPYPNNARTHSKKQIKQIAASIRRSGLDDPILIDHQKQIIAGHGRVERPSIGMDAVPTVRLSHLSDADKRAYVLADNRLAEKAGWDRETLAIEIQGLVDLGFDVEVTGFESAEVDLILEEADEPHGPTPGPEDDIPILAPQAISQSGDIWVLGQHRLMCGDARDDATYQSVLEGSKAAFVFTDPPFNVKIGNNVCGKGRIKHREFAMASGEMSRAEFTSFLETIFRQLVDHTTNGSICQVCMDWRHMTEMLTAGEKIFGELKNLCVWNKSNAGLGSFYRSKHELVFIWKNGDAPHVNTFRTRTTRSTSYKCLGLSWNFEHGGRSAPRVSDASNGEAGALVVDAIKDCSHRGGLELSPNLGDEWGQAAAV